MGWLTELMCPEHGLPVLLPALYRYAGWWKLGMSFHIMKIQANAPRIPDEPTLS